MARLMLLIVLMLPAAVYAQRGVYISVDDFLAQSFDQPPQPQMLWFSAEQKKRAEAVVNHRMGLRLRYFRGGDRTVWVLEEIGKELPITVGVVVEHNQIIKLQVLEFREVRGSEVRHGYFTDQFNGLTLKNSDLELTQTIDGITGATLSVHALKKIAKLALYFHQQVVDPTLTRVQP